MPTLKAIHICNYSRILNLYFRVRELTFRTSQPHKPKLAKAHVFANADSRTKKKYDCPKLAIRNAGEIAYMKVITLIKLTTKRKMKFLEIPHYA